MVSDREGSKKRYSSRVRKNKQAKSEQAYRIQAPITGTGIPLNPNIFDEQAQLRKKAKKTTKEPTKSVGSKTNRKIETKKINSKTGKKAPKKTKNSALKWLVRLFSIGVILTLIGIIVGAITFIVLYQKINIPSPNKFAQAQVTTVYWGDGKKVMGKFAERNRTNIKIKDLPKYVGNAVIASEDRTFYENNGIDFRGIGRAIINNIQGKPLQGASTLTQQYAENYYIGQNHSYTGKIKETILALKISRQQSKQEILNNYLNTIYFGRGSYGIEAASISFFNKSAKDLTLSEAALLAGIIPAPSAWDPQANKDIAEKRWNRVLNLMVEDGWITKAERDKQKFPQTVKFQPKNEYYTGSTGYLLQQAKVEVAKKTGYSVDDIERLGLHIYTTIDPDKQQALVDAVNNIPAGASPNLRVGAISVNPHTGAILAEYAGKDYKKIQSNAVTQDRAKAGSTFKAFTLLGGIINGYKLTDVFDGNNPVVINNKEIYNFGHRSYGQITLIKALQYSVNTSFIRLNEKIGMKVSRDVAVAAGFPEDTAELNIDSPIGAIGVSYPHTIDLAQGFATFANLGVRVENHLVDKVLDSEGKVIYQADTKGTRQFKESDIRILNTALKAAARTYSANALGREIAGKTGTTDESAQFVGFTNQILTAVSVYQVGPKGEEEKLTPFGGYSLIDGGSIPTRIWLDYMRKAVQGTKAEPIPDSNNAKDKAEKESGKEYRKVNYEKTNNIGNKKIVTERTQIPQIPPSKPEDENGNSDGNNNEEENNPPNNRPENPPDNR